MASCERAAGQSHEVSLRTQNHFVTINTLPQATRQLPALPFFLVNLAAPEFFAAYRTFDRRIRQ